MEVGVGLDGQESSDRRRSDRIEAITSTMVGLGGSESKDNPSRLVNGRGNGRRGDEVSRWNMRGPKTSTRVGIARGVVTCRDWSDGIANERDKQQNRKQGVSVSSRDEKLSLDEVQGRTWMV
jgi:hypothetical protein